MTCGVLMGYASFCVGSLLLKANVGFFSFCIHHDSPFNKNECF